MSDEEDVNREEQTDEIAALQSMYPDDFELLQDIPDPDADNSDPPKYKISLLPTEPYDDEVNHIGCVLEVR